jgi:hypothetical protein
MSDLLVQANQAIKQNDALELETVARKLQESSTPHLKIHGHAYLGMAYMMDKFYTHAILELATAFTLLPTIPNDLMPDLTLEYYTYLLCSCFYKSGSHQNCLQIAAMIKPGNRYYLLCQETALYSMYREGLYSTVVSEAGQLLLLIDASELRIRQRVLGIQGQSFVRLSMIDKAKDVLRELRSIPPISEDYQLLEKAIKEASPEWR